MLIQSYRMSARSSVARNVLITLVSEIHPEHGTIVAEEKSRSIIQVMNLDSAITYCRPKDMIGDSVSMTGKLASVVGKRAKFEDCFVVTIEVGIVEIVEADTLVVAASAS